MRLYHFCACSKYIYENISHKQKGFKNNFLRAMFSKDHLRSLLKIPRPWDFPGGPVVKTLHFQAGGSMSGGTKILHNSVLQKTNKQKQMNKKQTPKDSQALPRSRKSLGWSLRAYYLNRYHTHQSFRTYIFHSALADQKERPMG